MGSRIVHHCRFALFLIFGRAFVRFAKCLSEKFQADASMARRSQSSGTPDDSLRRALKENVAPRSAPPHPNAKSVRFQLPDDSAGSVFSDGSGTSSPALMSTPAMPSRRFGSQLQPHDNMQVMSPLNGMVMCFKLFVIFDIIFVYFAPEFLQIQFCTTDSSVYYLK
jgi:hypothetical protein